MAVTQAAARAQAGDPQDLLQRVRGNVTDTLARLPKYMCSLSVERAQYAPDPRQALSCDRLAGLQNKGQFKPRLVETDRVRLDVAIGGADEIYSWSGEDRFDDRDLFLDLVREGALQNGGFSSFLSSIFVGSAATVSYYRDTIVDGRALSEFRFRVPQEYSNYVFGNRREQVAAGYQGSFLADPKTGDLVRLVVRTSGLPAESGACEATTTLDYSRMRLNDSEFLLPREGQLSILNTNGSELRNRTVYASCHEFRGESTIQFDQPGQAPETAAPRISPPTPLALPAGLDFKVRFTQPIDTEAAAAGDRIAGKLSGDIRDVSSKIVLVPAGSEIAARIVRMEHFPGPAASVRMLVKLETLNVGGKARPFMAAAKWAVQPLVEAPVEVRNPRLPSMLDASTPGRVVTDPAGARLPPRRVLQQTRHEISLDPLNDPSVGVFEFRDVKPNFVVKTGLESNWITVAP